MESVRPQQELPTAFVIAHQYFSATFISLRFNFCKEILRTRSIKFISIDFYVSKTAQVRSWVT
jgi:hypothetical protein